jgi:hypothetical protein
VCVCVCVSISFSTQWHHAIPQDIVSKSFVEVCGDLNVTLMLHFAVLFIRNGFDNGPLNCMMSAKAVCAFLGQWSHRMAHTQLQHRPAWVKTAQNVGLLVSPELHKTHHTVYDDGFPILNGIPHSPSALSKMFFFKSW